MERTFLDEDVFDDDPEFLAEQAVLDLEIEYESEDEIIESEKAEQRLESKSHLQWILDSIKK